MATVQVEHGLAVHANGTLHLDLDNSIQFRKWNWIVERTNERRQSVRFRDFRSMRCTLGNCCGTRHVYDRINFFFILED